MSTREQPNPKVGAWVLVITFCSVMSPGLTLSDLQVVMYAPEVNLPNVSMADFQKLIIALVVVSAIHAGLPLWCSAL